nr:Mobilization protein mbeA [Klebsiella pneumoniae]
GRGAERARQGLQNADAEFERAAQHHKALKLKISQWYRTYNGPTL